MDAFRPSSIQYRPKRYPGLNATLIEPLSFTDTDSDTHTPTVASYSGSTTPTGSGMFTPNTAKGSLAGSYFDDQQDDSSGSPHDCPFCPCTSSGLLDGPDGLFNTDQLRLVVTEACENLKTARTTVENLKRFPSGTSDDAKKMGKAEAKIAQSTKYIMAVWNETATEIPYVRYLRRRVPTVDPWENDEQFEKELVALTLRHNVIPPTAVSAYDAANSNTTPILRKRLNFAKTASRATGSGTSSAK